MIRFRSSLLIKHNLPKYVPWITPLFRSIRSRTGGGTLRLVVVAGLCPDMLALRARATRDGSGALRKLFAATAISPSMHFFVVSGQ